MKRGGATALWTAVLLLLACAISGARAAGDGINHTSLIVEAGAGKVITLASPVANIFVADPKVAEVRPASATALFIFGLNAGRTTIAMMDADGKVLAQYDVNVQPSSFAAKQAQVTIERLLPNSHVTVQAHGKGLMLSGTVKNPADAAQAVAIAKGFAAEGGAIANEIAIDAPLQVTLSVRIAQMSRNVVRNLGINWSAISSFGNIATLPAASLNVNGSTLACAATAVATGGVGGCPGLGFSGVIDALARDNLAHVLAEPNLTVISGQPASFQVGGEYPVPATQGVGGVSITYKSFGVQLSFLPTVLSDGRINLHVKPEVSELSSINSVSITSASSTIVVPSLTVRRADTTVELGSGESLAIAGMLQQSTNDNGAGIPGIGDIPYLGALAHDNQFNRTETELVIVVTPYIVRPVTNPNALRLPTDGYKPPSDMERLLLMRQIAKQRPPVPVSIPGSAGFIVQ